MYSHPFWVGVAATILAELFALLAALIVIDAKKRKK